MKLTNNNARGAVRFAEHPRLPSGAAALVDDFKRLAAKWLSMPAREASVEELLVSLLVFDAVTHPEELGAAMSALTQGPVEVLDGSVSAVLACPSFGVRRVIFHPYTAAVASSLFRNSCDGRDISIRRAMAEVETEEVPLRIQLGTSESETADLAILRRAAESFWRVHLPGPLHALQTGILSGRCLTSKAYARVVTGLPNKSELAEEDAGVRLVSSESASWRVAASLARRVAREYVGQTKATFHRKLLAEAETLNLSLSAGGRLYLGLFHRMLKADWASGTVLTYLSAIRPYSELMEAVLVDHSCSWDTARRLIAEDLYEGVKDTHQADLKALVALNHLLDVSGTRHRFDVGSDRQAASRVLIEVPSNGDIERARRLLSEQSGDAEEQELCRFGLFLLIECTLRRSEMEWLRLGDVHLDPPQYLVVNPTASGGLKSMAAARVLPLPKSDETTRFVEFVQRRRGHPKADPISLVFARQADPRRPIYVARIAPILTAALMAASGATLGLHAFRARRASEMYLSALTEAGCRQDAGTMGWETAELLGHADPSITIQNYVTSLDRARAKVTSLVLIREGLVPTASKLRVFAAASEAALRKRREREGTEAFVRERLGAIFATPTLPNSVDLRSLLEHEPGNPLRPVSTQAPHAKPTWDETLEIAAAVVTGLGVAEAMRCHPHLISNSRHLERATEFLNFKPATSMDIQRFSQRDVLKFHEIKAAQKVQVTEALSGDWSRALGHLELSLSEPWRATSLEPLKALSENLDLPRLLGLSTVLKLPEDDSISPAETWPERFDVTEWVPRRQLKGGCVGLICFAGAGATYRGRRRAAPRCQLAMSTVSIAVLFWGLTR